MYIGTKLIVHIPVKVSHPFRFKVSHFFEASWCSFIIPQRLRFARTAVWQNRASVLKENSYFNLELVLKWKYVLPNLLLRRDEKRYYPKKKPWNKKSLLFFVFRIIQPHKINFWMTQRIYFDEKSLLKQDAPHQQYDPFLDEEPPEPQQQKQQ